MNLTKFFIVALMGIVGVILADETDYSYWRPDDATNFDEVAYQSLQSIPHEKQDLTATPIAKFLSGIQNRQFVSSIAPVSVSPIPQSMSCLYPTLIVFKFHFS